MSDMRAVIALAMMFGWALPANADNHVGVVVTGDSPELALIAAHFMDWLTNHGRVVVATPLSPAAITEVADCFAIDHPDCGRRSVDRL
jgi:hypothetical protein